MNTEIDTMINQEQAQEAERLQQATLEEQERRDLQDRERVDRAHEEEQQRRLQEEDLELDDDRDSAKRPDIQEEVKAVEPAPDLQKEDQDKDQEKNKERANDPIQDISGQERTQADIDGILANRGMLDNDGTINQEKLAEFQKESFEQVDGPPPAHGQRVKDSFEQAGMMGNQPRKDPKDPSKDR